MMTGKRLVGLTLTGLLLLVVFAGGWVVGRLGIGPAVDPSMLSEAERAFTERMRGSTLEGHFTVAGRETPAASVDRYDIASVEKIGDDLWRFNARIRHDDFDVTLPIAVPMTFVGDTPVIMMTDYTIPPLGTFTVRLFFYEDRYAGTWQHGSVGGLMYGNISTQ